MVCKKENIVLCSISVLALALMIGGCGESEASYEIGNTGPAGGLIFYIDDANAHTWTYLEAAPHTWIGGAYYHANATWGPEGEAIGESAQGTAIGDGRANTTVIVNWLEDKPESGRAAQVADGLELGGYSDWFLPSIDELDQMYLNLHERGIGSFTNNRYWSSSEYPGEGTPSNNNARVLNFNTGDLEPGSKSTSAWVRPIRAF